MPLETASYISDLQPSNPASTDPLGQADDHIRLLKSVLKATFPNINGPVTASDDTLNTTSPIGLIALWYGSEASCPAGWAVCNGATVAKSDGTGNITVPNLVDRFVVGAGGSIAAQGATAGSVNAPEATTGASGGHTHVIGGGSHTHTGTVAGTALTVAQLPAHDHGIGVDTRSIDGTGGFSMSFPSSTAPTSNAYINDTGSGATHTHGLTVDASASHTHTVDTVAGHTHTVTVTGVVPPAMGLHYIMKV